jgi:hypothetical protein
MSTIDALLLALIVSKVVLITVIYFLWRSNSRLREANHIIFLMKRRGIVNEKDLEELRNKATGQDKENVN